jgi:hypothetical protein
MQLFYLDFLITSGGFTGCHDGEAINQV